MNELTAELSGIEREGWLNLDEYDMEGLEVVDDKTLNITIHGRYPQFVYWLAMRFFSPIPPEADRFYKNPGFIDRNLTLDWWPVGSGPFMMVRNDPNSEIVLARNPNFREDYFPSEGEPGDREGRQPRRRRQAPATGWTASYSAWKKKCCPCGPSSCRAITTAPAKTTAIPTACSTRPSWSARRGGNVAEEIADHGIQMDPDVKPGIYYYGFKHARPGGRWLHRGKAQAAPCPANRL